MYKIVAPNFNGSSLLNIPSTILSLFGAKPLKKMLNENLYRKVLGVEKIILFVVDGFGDNLYQTQAIKSPIFRNILDRGFYNTVTAGFPPTTAASLNTLHSGLSPLEHGLPEWYVYFQEMDCVIQSLPFIPIVSDDLNKTLNPPEDILFKDKTIYQYLSEINIPSAVVIPANYIGGLYNNSVNKGCREIGYQNISEMMKILKKLLKEEGKQYIFAYWPNIDTAEHQYGIGTEPVNTEVSFFAKAFSDFIAGIPRDTAKKVGLMMTADHGHLATNPEKTIYLEKIPGLVENFKKSKNGSVIPPSGGPLNVFLNIKEEKIDDTIQILNSYLKDKAQVFKMADVIKMGMFGSGQIHSEFLNRVGNLLVLPDKGETIWYHFAPEIGYKLHGSHGGLSADTMMVPFICAKLSDLKT